MVLKVDLLDVVVAEAIVGFDDARADEDAASGADRRESESEKESDGRCCGASEYEAKASEGTGPVIYVGGLRPRLIEPDCTGGVVDPGVGRFEADD